jgi:hypothetical protein
VIFDIRDHEWYGMESGWSLHVSGSSSASLGTIRSWNFDVEAWKKYDVRTKDYSAAHRHEVFTFQVKVVIPDAAGPFELTEEDKDGLDSWQDFAARGRMWKRIDQHKPAPRFVERFIRRMAKSETFNPRHIFGMKLGYTEVMAERQDHD